VGEKPYAEGWGDAEYPVLSTEDLQAIKNLQAAADKLRMPFYQLRRIRELHGWPMKTRKPPQHSESYHRPRAHGKSIFDAIESSY
jgi:hypothetical protein